MRRRLSPVVGLFALIVVFSGFAWLTRNPDANLVRRAREWPVIGPLAEAFHRAYVPPPDPGTKIDRSHAPGVVTEYEIVVVEPERNVDFEPRGATPFVWVGPGSPIHLEPDTSSAIVETTSALANLPVLDRQGDWYRIVRRAGGETPITGWIHLQDYRDPVLESSVDPVLPLPANRVDNSRLELALTLMDGTGQEYHCGDYRLVTDSIVAGWLALCPELVADLERVYVERYALESVSAPAETIIFFSRREAYESFRDQEEIDFESPVAHSYPSRGYIALFEADRSQAQVVSSLVHELTHLLNRRSLGPALPPWIAEGMADDLAESATDALGRVSPGELGGEARTLSSWTLRTGGVASLIRLQTLDQLGTLPTLSELIDYEPEEFYSADQSQNNYALSSFWIRYLLAEPESERARRFRRYLGSIAAGQPISETLLTDHLGEGPAGLEEGFRVWLRGLSIG